MTEPITTNKSLIIPNTGDLVAAWGTSALNPNWQTVDSMFGGVTTISLSVATTLLLTVPATTGVWPGSLSQSVNSLIKFTGVQSGPAVVQFTLPGFYIVNNQCTGAFYVELTGVNVGGKTVGAPPGKKCHVFYDGTDMDYVNMPDPGSAYDLHTNTTVLPLWMQACTVPPYLIKDGTVYSTSLYPALGQLLGSTYGGNGVTTFGVPDERNRYRLPIDPGAATGRVTSGVSGVSGSTYNSAGGSQSQTLTLSQIPTGISVSGTITVYPSGNASLFTPNSTNGWSGDSYGGGANFNIPKTAGSISYNSAFSGSNSMTSTNTGGGAHPILPPTVVSFLPLIKT